jgi:hypothetical protein
MSNPVRPNAFMSDLVKVNSFQRTGNIFLDTVLRKYLGQNKIAVQMFYKESYHNIDILCDESIPQIVILRNPADCIVSNKIYRENMIPDKEYTMLRSILDWLEWHITFLNNIDILYPLTFEQVTQSTEKCLRVIKDQFYSNDLEVVDISVLLDKLKTEVNKKDSVSITSKTSKDYDDLISSYYSADFRLIGMVDRVYADLKEKVVLRQSSLSWTL